MKPLLADTRWLQKSQQYVIDENKLWPTVHPASRLLRHTSRAAHISCGAENVDGNIAPDVPPRSKGKVPEAETLLPLIQNCHNNNKKIKN